MPETDHPLKRLVELAPEVIAAWLLGVPVLHAISRRDELIPIDDPVDADFILQVTLTDGRIIILHIEFQALGSKRQMSLRMLDYHVRIYIKQRTYSVMSYVIYLGGAGATDLGVHSLLDLHGNVTVAWQYGVVHLWKMTSEELLALDKPTLAVLIGQTKIINPERDLRQALRRINENTSGELRERLFAELLLLCTDEEIAAMARQIFKQDYGLPEPPILTIVRREGREEGWQEGREEGREEGWQAGREEGRAEGREEGREEGQATITLRQLTRRFGELPEPVVAQVRGLGSAGLLELADALLDFTEYRDLTDWLAAHHSATMHAE